MSLRPTKKQKLMSTTEKLRPPTLIPDLNAGKFQFSHKILNYLPQQRPISIVAKLKLNILVLTSLFVRELANHSDGIPFTEYVFPFFFCFRFVSVTRKHLQLSGLPLRLSNNENWKQQHAVIVVRKRWILHQFHIESSSLPVAPSFIVGYRFADACLE